MPTFIRLVDYGSANTKEREFFNNDNYYHESQGKFLRAPGTTLPYWLPEKMKNLFDLPNLSSVADVLVGISTANAEKYLRFWHEVSLETTGNNQQFWHHYRKGGTPKKWFGNNEFVIWWRDAGKELSVDQKAYLRNIGKQGQQALSFSHTTSSFFALRYQQEGQFFDFESPSIFCNEMLLVLACLNSKCVDKYLSSIDPSLHFNISSVLAIPYPEFTSKINIFNLVKNNIALSKSDWDLHETSWDFRRSSLLTDYSVRYSETAIDTNLTDWSWPSVFKGNRSPELAAQTESFIRHWTSLFLDLRNSEEELNRIFIELYDLKDELTPDIPYTEITILQDELNESLRKEDRLQFDEVVLAQQFVSYGIGCLMGRYSVEQDGFILADAGATLEDFKIKIPNARFLPDGDGILPLTDEDDFSDDLPTAFKSWLRFISDVHYDANLRWIEDRLGKDLRSFFDRDFYKDHVKRYKSRPIYWMVSSPSGAFRALIYLHRYTKDTVGKILNDYVRPYRTKIDQKIRGLESIIDSSGSSAGEKTKAKKRLAQLEKYKAEIEAWEKESLYPLALKRVELDLDDGVKVNYRKLEGILEPVKQLEAKEEE